MSTLYKIRTHSTPSKGAFFPSNQCKIAVHSAPHQLSVGGWCGDYNANFSIVGKVVLLHPWPPKLGPNHLNLTLQQQNRAFVLKRTFPKPVLALLLGGIYFCQNHFRLTSGTKGPRSCDKWGCTQATNDQTPAAMCCWRVLRFPRFNQHNSPSVQLRF